MLDDLRGDSGACLQDGVLCRLEKCETTIREVHGTVEEVQRAVKDLAVPTYLEEFAEMRTRVSEVWNIFKEFASALPSDGQHPESKVAVVESFSRIESDCYPGFPASSFFSRFILC